MARCMVGAGPRLCGRDAIGIDIQAGLFLCADHRVEKRAEELGLRPETVQLIWSYQQEARSRRAARAWARCLKGRVAKLWGVV